MFESLAETVSATLRLLRPHGRWLFFELMALGIAVDLVFLLARPGIYGPLLGFSPEIVAFNEGAFYPYLVVSSLVFTCLIAHQITRIYLAETDGAAHPDQVMALVRAALVPLLVIQAGIDAAFLLSLVVLVFLGPVILALTTLTIPTVVIEGRGWAGLARNLSLVSGIWGRLAVIWAVVLLATMIGGAFLRAWAEARMGVVTEGVAALTFATVTSIPSAAMNAVAVCLIVSVYREVTRNTPSRPDLPEIFR